MQQFLAPNAADMQKNAAANNQEFQKSIGTFSQEFQKAFMSQEVQEAIFVLASDTQQCIWVSQDYQKYYSNANFQALNSVMFIMSSDIQNSFLCAFDDYMKMW
jgi:hypothetical protein